MTTYSDNGSVGTRVDATAELAAVARSSHDAIVGKDLDGRITSWNPGAERLYGYRPEEVLGRPSSMLVHPDFRAVEAETLARTTRGDPTEMFRTRHVHKTGATLQVSLALSPMVGADGAIVGVASSSRDVGELVLAESRFQVLLEAAPDGMICVDAAGLITLVNTQVEHLFGYLRDELIGHPVEDLLPTAAAQVAYPTLRPGFVADPAVRPLGDKLQFLGRRKDGTTFPADVNVSSVQVADGLFVMATVRDATERIGAQTALQESESRLRQLAESVDVAFVLRSLDPPAFLYVSPGYAKILGYDPMVTHEDPAVSVQRIHAEDLERFLADYWAYSQAGLPARAEFRIIRPDGQIRWVRAATAPVADPTGLIRRSAATVEDITERKHGEAALQSARAEADAANAAKTEFLSRMSHELRTPLNAVLGFAQVLELDHLTDDQQEAVQHILGGGRHLLGLIDDVLDIAKIDSARLDVSLDTVAVGEMVTATVELMRPTAAEQAVTLYCRPSRGDGHYVTADPRRLRQVILNLLSNAIKYNQPGGRVDVSWDTHDHHTLDITVRDNGRGIHADNLARLFTPFDRLDAAVTGTEGSGVGLALSQRLMTTMGGNLQAQSEFGVGSIFTASIRLATRQDHPADPAPPTNHTGHGALSSCRLLYIEDNDSNIHLMRRLLEHRPQWHLTVAGRGRHGLELATTTPPDLVLLDLHLPDMNGIDVLHQLRTQPATRAVRVVVVSADAHRDQINRLRSAGAHDYLTKPLNITEVLTILDQCQTERTGVPEIGEFGWQKWRPRQDERPIFIPD